MTVKKAKVKSTSFYKRGGYNTNNWWKPGQPVTEEDNNLLQKVKDFYTENGYSPSKADMNDESYVVELKARFRTWGNIMVAAGLPYINAPENQKIRQQKSAKTINRNIDTQSAKEIKEN